MKGWMLALLFAAILFVAAPEAWGHLARITLLHYHLIH